MAVIGSVIGTLGSVMQLAYQSAIASANAKQADYNAAAASTTAQQDVEDIGLQNKGELGQIATEQGSSGFAVSSPSFVSGIKSFLGRAYETAQRRMSEGNQRAAGYRTEANIQRANASAASAAIPFTILGGVFNALSNTSGNLIGGAQPTAMNADYIPLPRIRPTLGATGQPLGTGARGMYYPQLAF